MELTALKNYQAEFITPVSLSIANDRKFFIHKKSFRVSIITVSYNSAATIKNTLESVRDQNYSNIEHIIIDGGSSDATLKIIDSFDHIAHCISEKDNGIYDAMNKGLQMASGDIIAFLNSDDVYADATVISNVVKQFEYKNTDTVYGDLNYVHKEDMNRVVRKWTSGNYTSNSFKMGWMPPHPSFFALKKVYEKVGGFNISLKSASDYELMLRILFKHRFNARYLKQVLVKMRTGGVSNSSFKNRIRANREDRMAWKLNNLHPYFFTLYLKPLRKVFQFGIPLLSSIF
ncbi:MAG TPA: glycosyltransferase family 2 protein [Flavisolibacter sp.]|nr:glycosyltransferase family 2 protein [Flavisolibacter sp.]